MRNSINGARRGKGFEVAEVLLSCATDLTIKMDLYDEQQSAAHSRLSPYSPLINHNVPIMGQERSGQARSGSIIISYTD